MSDSKDADVPAVPETAKTGAPAAGRRFGRSGRSGPQRRQLALIGVLLAALGFAIAVQVQATSSTDALTTLRQSDLIQILDNQNARADRLRTQIAQLQATLDRLRSSGDQSAAAQAQARAELQALQILLGTIPATGPGVVIRIDDASGKLGADTCSTWSRNCAAPAPRPSTSPVCGSAPTPPSSTASATVLVDGHEVHAPYAVTAIGDPSTLQTALNDPGRRGPDAGVTGGHA